MYLTHTHIHTYTHTRVHAESEEEVRRMARELRDFDTLLAESEEKTRVERWRQRTLDGEGS